LAVPMNHSRQRMCKGKIRHASLAKAITAMRKTGETFGDLTLYAYPCKHCKGFHVGHPPKARQKELHYRRLLTLIDRANGR
jgi:hypothetical protein